MLPDIRAGIGYDSHAFTTKRKLILGGVEIEFERGLAGHSDADALVHAVIDSLLGASGLGDIGRLFPDNDPQYKDISSLILLRKTYELLNEKSIAVLNIDTVIICEAPKLAPYSDLMKKNISDALGGLNPDRISIKAKTNEKMGFTGRGEGIAVHAVSLIAFVK